MIKNLHNIKYIACAMLEQWIWKWRGANHCQAAVSNAMQIACRTVQIQ